MSLFKTKEKMFEALNKWDSKVFGKETSKIITTDENREIVKLLEFVIKKQKLVKRRMNGRCSMKLETIENEKLKISYVDIFNSLEETCEFWTPLDFLYEVCKYTLANRSFYESLAKKHKVSFDHMTMLICGRALRSLPSFIREYQLRHELERAFSSGHFYQGAEMDKKLHCDIKMELNGRSYFLWSFLSSEGSTKNFMKKFNGSRYGSIPDGVHVLCPFDNKREQSAAYKEWHFYTDRYIEEIKEAIFLKPHVLYRDLLKTSVDKIDFKGPIVVDKNTASFSYAV